MNNLTSDHAQRGLSKKRPHLLALAIKESTRLERLNIGVMLAYFVIVTVAFLISWAGHMMQRRLFRLSKWAASSSTSRSGAAG